MERRIIDVDLELECPKCGKESSIKYAAHVRYDDVSNVVDVWCPLCKAHIETFHSRDRQE